jgi:predicted dehydrogenase
MTKRREFIKKGVFGSAGAIIGGMRFSSKSYASIVGANDRINIAVIGIRGRGLDHLNELCTLKDKSNVWITTLCDADEQFFAPRAKTVFDKTGVKPSTEWDMRKVFDNHDIHAVTFATPNHWHALGTIWACQAGKHVYVEKPCCHNIFEGRKMIEASRKYKVRVQVGFQNRSGKNLNDAIKFLHDGGIGEIYMARGLCLKPRDSFGIARDGEPPVSLHYDQWLGPVSYRPYNEKQSHYNWHWFWDTGNGDTGNQGPHEFDVARWGMGKKEHPVTVYSAGGIFGIDPKECAQETPNTQSSLFKYSDGKMIEFETRGRYTNDESSISIRIGNIFYGTDGYLELYDESASPWKAFRKREKVAFAGSKEEKKEQADPTFMAAPPGSEHFVNFVNAIRSGKDEELTCDIREGYYSSVLPHLANISYRLGRQLHFDGANEKFVNDPEADKMLTRTYRNPFIVPLEV